MTTCSCRGRHEERRGGFPVEAAGPGQLDQAVEQALQSTSVVGAGDPSLALKMVGC